MSGGPGGAGLEAGYGAHTGKHQGFGGSREQGRPVACACVASPRGGGTFLGEIRDAGQTEHPERKLLEP